MPDLDAWRNADEKLLVDEEQVVTNATLDQINTLGRDLRKAAADGVLSDAEVHHGGEIWQDALHSHILPAIADIYARAYDWQWAQFEKQQAAGETEAFATKRTSSKDAQANAAEYIKTISNRLVGVADHIFADIRRELSAAIKGNETPQQMADRVDRVFAARGGNNWLGRAGVIARTETAAAINAGRMQAARKWAKDFGLKQTDIIKTWLTQKDDRVRDSHRTTHGQKQPLSKPFSVGTVKMMQPGDPKGPAEECVNCRCTLRFTTANTPIRGAATLEPEEDEMTTLAEEIANAEIVDLTEEEAAQSLEPAMVPWHGVLAPEGVMSGDRRKFRDGSLRHRDLPLPLMYQDATAEGHDGAVRVGNIQGIERAGGMIRGWGMFDTSDNADEAVRQIAESMLRGVSVDVDAAEFSFEDDDGNPIDLSEGPEFDEHPVMVVDDGRISGATLVSIPAFQEAFVALGPPPDDWGVQQNLDSGVELSTDTDVELDFATVSDKPWSDFSQADYSDEQWFAATVLHKNGDSRAKSDNGLPIREPSGTLNRNGVHAAAARFNQVDAPAAAKASAKAALRGAYKAIGEEPPDVIANAGEVDTFAGQPDAGIPGHMPEVLHSYWTHGEGAAKINWGVPGDFNRCRALLGKYVEKRMLAGLCAKLHNEAVGHWPGPGRGNAGETVDYSEGTAITEDCGCGSLAASGAMSDFSDPMFTAPTPLTITRDGRVFGHLATWGTCHIGLSGQCVTPPQSRTGYAYFRTGEVLTESGDPVAVGHITLGTGHAEAALAAGPAVEHYDHTGTVVADVAAGEDEYGIWIAGRLRSDLPAAVVDTLRAAALSGDWRRIGGSMELVAALAVNVPGFPIPRIKTAVRNRRQTALVASGIVLDQRSEDIVGLVQQALDTIRAREARAAKARDLAARVGRDPASRAQAATALVHGGDD